MVDVQAGGGGDRGDPVDTLTGEDDIEGRFTGEEDAESNALNPLGLSFRELRQLQEKFHDEIGQPIKLDEGQFVDALSFNRNCMSEAQYDDWHGELRTLFKKI